MNGKKALALLLPIALLLVAILPVAAQETDPTTEPVTEAAPAPLAASTELFVTPLFRVNVRSGPDTTYTVLGVVTPADTLDITGKNEAGTWLRLNYSGQEGWVLADLMDVTGDLEAAPLAEAGASAVLTSTITLPVVEGEPEAARPLEIRTLYNTNLRDSYTTDAEVLATIPYNSALVPQGRTDDSNWISVTVDEQSGWVYAPILSFVSGDVETLPILATVPPPVVETATGE